MKGQFTAESQKWPITLKGLVLIDHPTLPTLWCKPRGSVMRILDERKVAYESDSDLPSLYKTVAKALNLAPSQHSETIFKQILGGCTVVVEGLGALRNRLSDAHGQGKMPIKSLYSRGPRRGSLRAGSWSEQKSNAPLPRLSALLSHGWAEIQKPIQEAYPQTRIRFRAQSTYSVRGSCGIKITICKRSLRISDPLV